MFGRDKQDNDEDNTVPVSVIPSMNSNSDNTSTPPPAPQGELTLPEPENPVVNSAPMPTNDYQTAPAMDDPGMSMPSATPMDEHQDEPEPEMEHQPEAPELEQVEPEPEMMSEPNPDDDLASNESEQSDNNDQNDSMMNGSPASLDSLKQEALRELSPLINQLDQSPEDKYHLAKRVYEETKDHNMLNAVYEAAKTLPDEKAKAEAIFDVINKIDETT